MERPRVLVIGYGNPARGDDGVGPALATRLEAIALPGVTVEMDYQLSIEHAALAAAHDVVVFADAAVDADAPFYWRPVTPEATPSFSTHAATPAQVLHLARACFGATPRGHLLGIRAPATGGFVEALSVPARMALDEALAFLLAWLEAGAGAEGPATAAGVHQTQACGTGTGDLSCETAST